MLLGSLYWEGELPEQDGDKGKARRAWRDRHLHMATCRDLPGIPIRYGRRSRSRNGEFTIIFGGAPTGVAKMADLRAPLPVQDGRLADRAIDALRQQVKALAEAEGIWTDENKRHFTGWGLVCIAMNPKSKFRKQLCQIWTAHFRPQVKSSDYGAGILDDDGILQIPLREDVWGGLDYCLATSTKPDCPTPSARQVAEAVKLGSYFRRTCGSGIKTPEDNEILKYLG